jgi:hypothetical protein
VPDNDDALAKAYAAEDVVYVDVPAPGEMQIGVVSVKGLLPVIGGRASVGVNA